MEKEIWKQFRDTGYLVSTLGNVKSPHSGKLLKPNGGSTGYPKVQIKGKTVNVHRMVAECFLDNPDNLPLVNHKNSNRSDARVVNLEFCDYKENRDHAVEVGAININGENNGRAKLTQLDVDCIKDYLSMGFTNISLANAFSVGRTTISNIKLGKNWV